MVKKGKQDKMKSESLKKGNVIAKIKVIGVGGAGSNTVQSMINGESNNVEFIVMNTDMQDLDRSKASIKVQLGAKVTKGLGAGANPEVGKSAAEEDKDKIRTVLSDADLVFVTAGMGGGTGTGSAPVVAKIAQELGILTVAIVTKPFKFEGSKRKNNSEKGIEELRKYVDTIVVIPNDRLFELPNKSITLVNAFDEANKVLKIGMQGIADLITKKGYINLDYADIKAIISNSGVAMLGFGHAEGEDRARKATEQALSSPLLERPIEGARRVLLNINGGEDVTLNEANEIANLVTKATGNSVTEVMFGTVIDSKKSKGINVTVIATDFDEDGIIRRRADNETSTIRNVQTIPFTRDSSKTSEIDLKPNIEGYSDILDIPTVLRQRKK